MQRYFPILQWAPNYKRFYLPNDISAGLTVGIMLVPQGMAYSMIAGLPPVFGLYAALLPQVVYALMGTSRHLAVGPVAMDSLLVASGLGALAISGIDEYIAMAIFLALFMGVLQLLFGILKMGFLVNFMAKPVISGFTSAAAIIIGLSQLNHLLGVQIEKSNKIHELVWGAVTAFSEINWTTLAIGLIAMVVMGILKGISTKIPGALIVVVLGISGMYFFGWEEQGIKIVGNVPQGLPLFKVPSVEMSRISELLPIAITLALVAFLEAISVAKAVEERHKDYKVDANQELIALGMGNIIGSFFQSYPTTGGFSRTAVNDGVGSKTGLASIISAGVVGATLLFLTPLFHHLPNAILAAIIMVAVYGLIDLKYPKELYGNRRDEFFLLVATFLITLIMGIKEGILLGVLCSLLLLVYRTSKPHIAVLGKLKGTDYFRNVERFADDIDQTPELLMLRFDSQLYFGNSGYFKKELLGYVKDKGDALQTIILNAESINYIDSSAVYMLKDLIQDLQGKGITFMIAGAIGPTRDILYKSGLIDLIGQENIFVRIKEAFEHCESGCGKDALQQKVALQGQS